MSHVLDLHHAVLFGFTLSLGFMAVEARLATTGSRSSCFPVGAAGLRFRACSFGAAATALELVGVVAHEVLRTVTMLQIG